MFKSSNYPAGDFVGKEMLLLSAHINGLRTVLTGRMPARIEFTDEEIEEMTMMYRYGYSSYEIAEWFGVSAPTVLDRLREIGCEIRHEPGNYVKRHILDPWAGVDAAYVFGLLIGDASPEYRYRANKTGRGVQEVLTYILQTQSL